MPRLTALALALGARRLRRFNSRMSARARIVQRPRNPCVEATSRSRSVRESQRDSNPSAPGWRSEPDRRGATTLGNRSPNSPPERGVHAASTHAHQHAQKSSNALVDSHVEAT